MTIKASPKGRFRWPAEWEPHAGTAFTWLHNPATWHQGLVKPRAALTVAIRALAQHETVHLHFPDLDTERAALEQIDHAGVVAHQIPSNDAWCRDHGAVIVRRSTGERVALDFGFNAWGGKYPPWDDDARIATRMADYLGIDCESLPFVLEGGAIEGNGQGAIMTTASCVLNTNRNRAPRREDIIALFQQSLGADHVFWLEGDIVGDDTDGHIDNLARFVGPARALVVAPERPLDDAQRVLAANPASLARQARAANVPLEIGTLPIPQSFASATGLPASYANFYIGERCVLMPVYADAADDAACAIVEDCFPERELVPVDCRDLIVGLGALHCLTQTIPAA